MIGFALAAFYMLLYFITGSLITARMKKEYFSVTLTCIVGFFLYYLLFSIAALPMKLTLQPLSRLTHLWTGALVVIVILSVVINQKRWREWMTGKPIGKNWWVLALVVLLVVGQIAFIHQNAGMGSPMDAAYYIGEVTGSVATDTISQYDPFTGERMGRLSHTYLLITYQTHSMVMSQLFGVAPLIEMRTGMMAIVIILFHMCLYKCIVALRKKVDIYTVVALGMIELILFFDNSIFTPTGFYFYRTFEGKTVLAVIVTTAMLYFFIRVVKDTENNWNWLFLSLITCTSYVFSMSGMLLVPVFLSTALFGLTLSRKSGKIFLKMVVVLIPSLLLIFCYLLIANGSIAVSIPV